MWKICSESGLSIKGIDSFAGVKKKKRVRCLYRMSRDSTPRLVVVLIDFVAAVVINDSNSSSSGSGCALWRVGVRLTEGGVAVPRGRF